MKVAELNQMSLRLRGKWIVELAQTQSEVTPPSPAPEGFHWIGVTEHGVVVFDPDHADAFLGLGIQWSLIAKDGD